MTSRSVAVIDYGMGNLHSAAKALQHVSPDTQVVVSANKDEILACDHVIVPGVGAIRDCMGEIKRLGLDAVISQAIKTKPVMGICIGMQTMLNFSEENDGVHCMGIFEGEVRHYGTDLRDEQGEHLKVPHMGWNNVYQREDHPIWNGIEDGERFYFVHSYYVELKHQNESIGTCTYGHPFDAVAARDNIVAVQFHPEKSADAGLKLLKNFLDWDGGL